MKSGNDCVIWQEYNKPESILYGDGRRARMEYTPLGQLAMVKDWLGETRIERDSYGAPVCITDHKGRSVHYEWGGMGQRQGMEAEYFYNALGHRTGRSTGGEMEEYLPDLTKPYHNLLELRKGKHRQTFYRDMNVSAEVFQPGTLIAIVLFGICIISSNSARHYHQSEHDALVKFMEDLED